jgi:hypothetical protein
MPLKSSRSLIMDRDPTTGERADATEPPTDMGTPDADRSGEQMRDVSAKEESLTPADDNVRLRAYELYRRRGAEHGRDMDDWLEAERELRHEGEK